MKYTEATMGRVFVLRLEDGDKLPDSVESFCTEHNLSRGLCFLLGGIGGGEIVVGPADGDARPIRAMLHALTGVHEIAGVGTIFPDESGAPLLHMHAVLGRDGVATAGCIRPGIEVWQLGEVIILELRGTDANRMIDQDTGFAMLEPTGEQS